jgi:hypothetical protein
MRNRTLLLAALIVAGSLASAMAADPKNATNERLLAAPPSEQAEVLTKSIKGCAGTSAFPMGVTATGKARGFAYWSVRCQDGRSFVIQIAPDVKGTVAIADCQALQGTGKECFKKF